MTESIQKRPDVRAPEVRMADIVLPNQVNNLGTMFGGEVLALMDRAAAIAALQFCRQIVVTASTERIDFRTPIQRGEIIEALSRVIYVGRTSLIVRIHIYAEHPLTAERRLCTTGYFSMVGIDSEGRRVELPRLLVDNEAAEAEWELGHEIRRSIDARRGR